MGVEKIHSYEEKINFYQKRLADYIVVYDKLIDDIAVLEQKVRTACLDYMKANPDKKKLALEKIEILASTDDETAKDNYLQLVWLRHKQKSLEHMIEATQSGMSAVQSSMKYNLATDYTGGPAAKTAGRAK